MRFDTNIHSTLDWKFFPEKNTLDLKPGEVHTVKFMLKIQTIKLHQEQHLLMFLLQHLENI